MTASGPPWRIVHIDLAQPCEALSPNAPVNRVIAYFWWAGVPLGTREYDAGELPRPASAMAEDAVQAIAPAVHARLFPGSLEPPPLLRGVSNKAARMPTLSAILDGGGDRLNAVARTLALTDTLSAERLSVIVCTRERPELLTRCLRALTSARDAGTEIVVVDNSPSTAATRDVVAAFPDVTYVVESRPGLSAARNAGLRASTGDLVAFTDDDVEVHGDWTRRIRLAFRDPKVAAITGLVLPARLETASQIAFERGFGGFSGGFQALDFDHDFFRARMARGVPTWRLGAGANMAFRREVIAKIGDFDERLGAGAAGCSEDSELWYRLLAAGHVCRYEPAAVVFHHHREDWEALRGQAYSYMRGHVAALLIQFRRHRHWGNLWRLASDLPAYYAMVSLRHLSGRPRHWPFKLVRRQMLGCIAGLRPGLGRLPRRETPS